MINEGVVLPELLLHTAASPSGRGWSRDLLGYDREPIILCAKTLQYCFGSPAPPALGSQSKVDTWKEILHSLNLWYSNRPQDFKPMFELKSRSSQDQLFPLILFTNPAAIMANQLYHTAMLLLLQHKPKTVGAASGLGRSASMSPLWHAQKICGISINNDDINSWDFSLVASFYLAAKGMTYVPQQEVITRRVEKIATMTGWNLSSLLPRLRQIWHPD